VNFTPSNHDVNAGLIFPKYPTFPQNHNEPDPKWLNFD